MKRNLASGFVLPSMPKRTPVSEDKAARFTKSKEAQVPRSSKLRRTELGERLVVYLPPELATELRVRCARERRSLSDAVSEAVGAWVRSATDT